MDNKRLFSAMLVCLTLMLGWIWLMSYLDKKYPHWNLLNKPVPAAVASTQPGGAQPGVTSPGNSASTGGVVVGTPPAGTLAAPFTSPSTQPVAGATSAPAGPQLVAGLVARGADAAPVSVLLGSENIDDPTHTVGIRFTSRGAAVESVTLNRFKLHVEKPDPYVFQRPQSEQGKADAYRVLATRTVSINGLEIDLSGLNWAVSRSEPGTAVFSAEILDGATQTPLCTIVRTYTVDTAKDPSLGYELRVIHQIVSRTTRPLQVITRMNGPAIPPWEIERGPERQLLRGDLILSSQQVVVRPTAVEAFSAQKTRIDLVPSGHSEPMSWFGANGAYFNAIVRPEPLTGAAGPAAAYIARVEGELLNTTQADPHLRDVISSFTTTPLTVEPGTTLSLPLRVYFGPKQRAVLDTPFYAAYPLDYDATLVITNWLCSFCTFQWMIRLLVGMLNAFHYVVRDWGVAIILLVVVVRSLLHPVTRKAQENMVKMGKMAPELERIKKKYGDDKEGLNKAMMQFYKEQGATPIMGCLPSFLQMPIWLALYAGLQSTFELRHQPFFYGLTWITDLAKPDHLIYFPAFNLFGIIPISGFNVIPFLLAVVFFLQFKFTPKPPVQTPEQIQQQKMMQWMTLLFPVFLYSAPAGLNIYILTSTTFGIIENKLIRDALKRKDEAQAAGRVVTDEEDDQPAAPATGKALPAPAGGPGGRFAQKSKAAAKSAPKKGLMGGITDWITEMQEKAEEIRRQQEKRK